MDLSEYREVLDLNTEERYECFLDTIVEDELIWFLTDEDGDVVTLSADLNEQLDYIPLWPAREFAEIFMQDSEQKLVASSINIFEFLEKWVPALHEDGMSTGIFPNLEVTVWIIEPLDLQQDIVDELGLD